MIKKEVKWSKDFIQIMEFRKGKKYKTVKAGLKSYIYKRFERMKKTKKWKDKDIRLCDSRTREIK